MSAVRYFAVVGVQPWFMRVALYAAAAVAVWTIALDPAQPAAAPMSLLYLQMFASSTAFMRSAQAGHFDPLLTRLSSRRQVAVAHWWVSGRDGLVAWVMLALAAGALGGDMSSLLGLRAVSAIVLVSTLPWAAGTVLPRGAGGVLWTGVMIAVLAIPGAFSELRLPINSSAGTVPSFAASLALGLIFPFTLLEQTLIHPASARTVAAVLMLLSVAAAGLGVVTIERRSFPLSES